MLQGGVESAQVASLQRWDEMHYTIVTKPASYRRQVAGVVVPLQILLLIIWWAYSPQQQQAYRAGAERTTSGCLTYDYIVPLEPGDVVIIDASVTYEACETDVQRQKLK